MKWSFDDLHIGLVLRDGRSLMTKEIPRPPCMTRPEWHEYAKKICEVINRERSAAGVHIAPRGKY